MDVAQSLPCGRYLLAPLIGNKEGYSGLVLHQLSFRPTLFIPRWTLNLHIQRQVCGARVLDCMAILIVSRTARFD